MATYQTSVQGPQGQSITVTASSREELSEAVAEMRGADQQTSDMVTAFQQGGVQGLTNYLRQQGVPVAEDQ